MKKKALLSILTVGIAVSLITLGANTVSADDVVYPNIISRLAQKFNLNESDVEAVFDAVHEERQDQIQSVHEERLNQAVTDGVISEDQKNALLAKHQEMFTQRQEARETHHEEMQAWFEENGIDPEVLANYMGMGPGLNHGFKAGFRTGNSFGNNN
jgi:hypothetical protein